MRVLALETTDQHGTIAALEEGRIAGESTLFPLERRSAQTLVPSIEALMKRLGWSMTTLDGIAVALGPGSFTGLRVGVTTAKTLAYALSIPILGVDTLEAMALGVAQHVRDVVVTPALDAQRGDVAAARYYVDDAECVYALDSGFQVISVEKWLELPNSTNGSKNEVWEKNTGNENLFYPGLLYQKIQAALKKDYVYCGPILKKWENAVPAEVKTRFAPPESWAPSAACVARIAWRRMRQNDSDDLWALVPVYSRLSAAEERARAKAADPGTV